MNKNIVKLVIVVFLLFGLTGCTKYIKDEDNKIVKNKETGQNLTSNILCQPTNEKIISIYNNNNINISKLPKCEDMKISSSNYDGLWTTVFVQPLAWLIIQIGKIVKNYGLGIIFATILIRGILFPFTKKTALQSENLKKAKPELEKIEKKYLNQKDQETMMKKSQETMIVYKKYGINPLSGCLFAFIQIPIFFAFLEAINKIPVLFEGNLFGLQLGTSPAVALFTLGKLQYAILILFVVLSTYFSFKLTGTASMSQEQEKQMKTMTNIMMITMVIASFTISSGIAIYWITSSTFTIIQNLLVKRGVKNA